MTPRALVAAGARVERAVDDEVRPGLDAVTTAARAIAAALPGTRAAGLAEELARRWEAVGAGWVPALRTHGEALHAAAADQDATDAAAAASLASSANGTNGALVPYGSGPGSGGPGSGSGSGEGAP